MDAGGGWKGDRKKGEAMKVVALYNPVVYLLWSSAEICLQSKQQQVLCNMAAKMIVLALCVVGALGSAIPHAAQYPAGVNPHTCPNYPYCDNVALAAHGAHGAHGVAPYAAATYAAYGHHAGLAGAGAKYPAGVNPHACPNYPFCGPTPAHVPGAHGAWAGAHGGWAGAHGGWAGAAAAHGGWAGAGHWDDGSYHGDDGSYHGGYDDGSYHGDHDDGSYHHWDDGSYHHGAHHHW